MITLALSLAIGIVGDLPIDTTWTIASDGSVVELHLTSPTEDIVEDDVPQSQEEAMATHHRPEPKPLSPIELAIAGRRLPGPVHWYCPTCQSSSCLMYLGNHLRSAHGVSMDTIDAVTYRRLSLLHDNLHNAKRKALAVSKSEPTVVSGCQNGSCNVGPLRRFFRRMK